MKQTYTKPQLETKAYAQFENVFTACSKGNEKAKSDVPGVLCQSGVFETPSSDPSGSAAFKSMGSL